MPGKPLLLLDHSGMIEGVACDNSGKLSQETFFVREKRRLSGDENTPFWRAEHLFFLPKIFVDYPGITDGAGGIVHHETAVLPDAPAPWGLKSKGPGGRSGAYLDGEHGSPSPKAGVSSGFFFKTAEKILSSRR
jgi:hypothetical protein